MNRRKLHAVEFFGLLALVICAAAPQSHAQALPTGAILGTVTDPSGALVPDAQVVVTCTETGQSRQVATDSTGAYDVEALVAAGHHYDVTINKGGFETFSSRGNRLDAGIRLRVDAVLRVGATAEHVTVSAAPVTVQTESGSTGSTIGSQEISVLQVNGRNFTQLAMLTPGVNPTNSAQEIGGGGLTTFVNLSTNGLGMEHNQVMIDGVYNMNTGDDEQINVTPSMEALSEFRVLTGMYSAKYGLSGLGLIFAETKSGGTSFHGSAYDFLRNDALDSRNFFSAAVPPLKQNIFGFAIGGPAYLPGKYNTGKNKTFFFGSEEWRRRDAAFVFRTAVPTAAMRNGDFSQSPTLYTGALQLDAGSASILAQQHPNVNCVPSPTQLNPACFDSNSVLLMQKYWPLPNSTGFLNYNVSPVDRAPQREDLWRVDHTFSSRFSLMARFAREVVMDNSPVGAPNISWAVPGPVPTMGTRIGTTSFNNLVRFNTNLSPTTFNTITVAQTDDKPRLLATNGGLPPGTTIIQLFPNADPRHRSPLVTLADGWAAVGNTLPQTASDGEETLTDDFTKTKGKHVLQAGFLFIRGIKKQNQRPDVMGNFYFSGEHTNDPMADYLLGLDTSYDQSSNDREGYYHYHQLEEYFQDDWKATRRLTINIGLRNLYFSPDTLPNLPLTDWSPSAYDPSVAPLILPDGNFQYGANGQPVTAAGTTANIYDGLIYRKLGESYYTVPAVNLAPRFGFAYDLTGDGKTVLRGGAGLGYDRLPLNHLLGPTANPPFISDPTVINGTMTNPGLGVVAGVAPVSLASEGNPGDELHPVRIGSWNLTFERQLIPNGVMAVGYVGNVAHFLNGTEDINWPLPVSRPAINDPNCLSPGETIPSSGFDFDPCINLGLTSSTYTRPYHGYTTISRGHEGGPGTYYGNSNYNSLQAQFRYNAGRGSLVTVAYTYEKALTELSAGDFLNYDGSAQNQYNFEAEYGPPTWNRTHMLNFSYIYALPFFHNQTNRMRKALGGWSFAGLTAIESGFPLTAYNGINPGLGYRADCVASGKGPRTVTQWFNTSAFVSPPFGFYGNCANGTMAGPGLNSWDMALYKTFPIGEQVKIEFRGEAFNVWNHPSFDPTMVSTAIGAGDYGQLEGALDPRILEFALKISF